MAIGSRYNGGQRLLPYSKYEFSWAKNIHRLNSLVIKLTLYYVFCEFSKVIFCTIIHPKSTHSIIELDIIIIQLWSIIIKKHSN